MPKPATASTSTNTSTPKNKFKKIAKQKDINKLKEYTQEGNATNLKNLLNQFQEPVLNQLLDRTFKDGYTALHIAAENGHSECCSLLLENGANPDKQDIYRRTPLRLAACQGETKACQVLLKKGADTNITDMDNLSPLHTAVAKNHTDTCKLLLDNKANPNQTYDNSYPHICNGLTKGDSLLKAANHKNNTRIITLLLDAGAKPNKETFTSCNPDKSPVTYRVRDKNKQKLVIREVSLYNR